MLTNTFCHLPGIGQKTERGLWEAGVTSWDAPWPEKGVKLSRMNLEAWPHWMRESLEHHAAGNLGFFADKLPLTEHWRLFFEFRHTCAFLDIETTGLYGGEITTIALYDGTAIRHYVNGQNLQDFPLDVMDYRLLVTYNGRCFDIPYIERYFGIKLRHAHIDLRYPLRSLGLKGGLKGCEKQLGMARPGLEGVDGYFAVLLWNEYRYRQNAKALETLLAYNIQDTLSLHALVVHAHNAKIKTTPFAESQRLPTPVLPEPAFQADRETVTRLLGQMFVRNGMWES